MKKVFVGILAALALTASVFGADGIMAGEEDIKVVKTTWFDIIYGQECKDSAAVLYANADQIYMDLAEMYGYEEPPCRMPVVLTTQVEVFNAYFSTGYYNHIVLYVTTPIEELENQPDSLLWTFRHELTHAFTYNMKSWFFKLFSDSFSLALINVTPGMAEGATLTSESYEGNGRLNDEFAKQTVKQAKLEGKFPAYYDAQGSRNIYPVGSYYYFNGAFHEYLQKNYGMQKYANFWYYCVNKCLTTRGAFKKAYGLKLKNEWKKFSEGYKVPDIAADPLAAGAARDFFNPSAEEYSLNNNKGALYESLSVSEKGITYVDTGNNTLYFVSNEEMKKAEIQPEKLFQSHYMESAVQSKDGKYIAVTYYNAIDENYRYHVGIYDTENRIWYKSDVHGVKGGTIIQKDDDYYLVVLQFKGEKAAIKITKLIQDEKGAITGEENPVLYDLGRNQLPSCFVDLQNGTFAYIFNDAMKLSIQTMNLEGKLTGDYAVPEENTLSKFNMHYLSADLKNPDELYFTWVCKDSMPRLGKLNLNDCEFTLSIEDVSGGIFNPVNYNDQLLYGGRFYEQNRLLKKNLDFSIADKYLAEYSDFTEDEEEAGQEAALFDELDAYEGADDSEYSAEIEKGMAVLNLEESADPKAYNVLNYAKRGVLLPFSQLTSTSYDSAHYGSYSLPVGITYMTSNPWDSQTYTLSAGYGFYTNSAALNFSMTGGTDTSLLNWSAGLTSEFDKGGWKSADIKLGLGSNLYLNDYTFIRLYPSVMVHAGRSNATYEQLNSYTKGGSDGPTERTIFDRIGIYGNQDDMFYFYGYGGLTAYISSVHYVDDNRYGKAGILAGVLPYYEISYDFNNSCIDYNNYDCTLFAEAYVPHLLPFECVYGMTYNLPVKLVAAAFNTTYVYGDLINIQKGITTGYGTNAYTMRAPDLAMVGAEMLLFGKELQYSDNLFGIFFNEFNVSMLGSFGYDYNSKYGEGLGILNIPYFINEIMTGENKPIATFGLKAALSLNITNFGSLARTGYVEQVYICPTLYFADMESTPRLNIRFGLDVGF